MSDNFNQNDQNNSNQDFYPQGNFYDGQNQNPDPQGFYYDPNQSSQNSTNQPNFALQPAQNPQIEPNFYQPQSNNNFAEQPLNNSAPTQPTDYHQSKHQSLHEDYNFTQKLDNISINQPVQAPNFSSNLPPTDTQKAPQKPSSNPKKDPNFVRFGTVILVAVITLIISFFANLVSSGVISLIFVASNSPKNNQTIVQEVTNTKITNEESAVVDVAKIARESVVSVIVSRDLSKLEKTQERFDGLDPSTPIEIGSGSGFVVSQDGYIVTNRHVVEEVNDDYTAVFDNGDILTAKVLARDTLLDIAIIKVEPTQPLKAISLGSSESLQVGQTAIAIGNSLGEFSNSVSKGIISGLGRTIVATNEDGTSTEVLDEIIQTDASINQGNSGGPLLDINGNVIGVNVARSQDGENIGFSIPIDSVKFVLDSVQKTGKIQRPYLGVQYTTITSSFANNNGLSVNYGALVSQNEDSPAIVPNSPADKAGVRQGDVILEIDGQKIDAQNDLRRIIQKKKVDDVVKLKILRDDKNLEIGVKLEASQ
jgi:serine protease Do